MRFLPQSGMGVCLWPSEPFRARQEEPRQVLTASTPDEDEWGTLIAAGYLVRCHITIDGIPWVLSESALLDVFGRIVAPPSDYDLSPCLALPDNLDLAIDCDRERGIAAGRSVDFALEWGQLEADALTTSLFRVPTVYAALTETVSDVSQTNLPVDSSTGLVAGEKAYLGHECIEPSGLTSASLEGVRRGICGPAHYHLSQTGSGFRYVTDTPMAWTGRIVTLWEHLCSPDGRALGGDYATVGQYVRQRWKGYLEKEPTPGDDGMVLRALPLPRLLAEEIGVKVRGEVNFDSNGFPYPLGMGASDTLRITETAGSGLIVSGPDNPASVSPTSIATWCALFNQNVRARSGSDIIGVEPDVERWHLRVRARYNAESSHNFSAFTNAWFLAGWIHEGTGSGYFAEARIPLNFASFGRVTWLPVRFEANEDGTALDVPSSGSGVLEVGGEREMVTWDEVLRLSDADDSQPMSLRLTGRSPIYGGDSGPRTLDWSLGGTLTMAVGGRGTWADVFRTVVTSSGSGQRGPFDVLGFGFGYGLSEDHIDVASLDLVTGEVEAFAEGRASAADLLCGWAALQSLCVVQRRGTDGIVRLAVVSTDPRQDSTARELVAGDVLLDGHKRPEKLPAPNQVEVDATTLEGQRGYIARDRARQQNEKAVRTWKLKAPGITEVEALSRSGHLMRLADGQEVQELEVPASVELQVGDAVVLGTEHRGSYDWVSGQRAPAARDGVVIGVGPRFDLTRATVLLAGYAAQQVMLCPSPLITHYVAFGGGSAVRVNNADADWFEAGDEVVAYTPGADSSGTNATILAKTRGETETVLTLDNTFTPAIGTTRITFANDATVVARQLAGFMFVRSDRNWR
jgi:hypothetical protein